MAEPTSNSVTTPWGRQQAGTTDRATSRTRKVVHGLPAWEPLPPGETLAPRRPRHQ